MKYLYYFLGGLIIFAPLIVLGQSSSQTPTGIVPSCGVGSNTMCTYSDLITLANKVISFLLFLSIPISVGTFTWAGFLYMSSSGDTSKIKKAHGIFINTAIGLFFALSAWLIVYLITNTLLTDEAKKFLPLQSVQTYNYEIGTV